MVKDQYSLVLCVSVLLSLTLVGMCERARASKMWVNFGCCYSLYYYCVIVLTLLNMARRWLSKSAFANFSWTDDRGKNLTEAFLVGITSHVLQSDWVTLFVQMAYFSIYSHQKLFGNLFQAQWRWLLFKNVLLCERNYLTIQICCSNPKLSEIICAQVQSVTNVSIVSPSTITQYHSSM